MADRRIDQLTEAEDISDEDLFVIWKENISQTRSIKKGTMNLATEQDVITSRKLDWENAVAITSSQILNGYTFLSSGILTGTVWKDNASNQLMYLKINDVTIAMSMLSTTGDRTFANTSTPVQSGDVLSQTGATVVASNLSFVPYIMQ